MLVDENIRRLSRSSENRPIRVEDIPKEIVDNYGIPSMYLCLNVEEKNPIDFDLSRIDKKIVGVAFNSIGSLVDLINQFETEIMRLYAIFCYIGHNIEYNYSGYLSGNYEGQDFKSIFNSKRAVCEGYSNLYLHLASKCNISSIVIKKFSSYAKGISYDPYSLSQMNQVPESNHATIYVEYLNELYMIDPTWGAGYIMKGKFEFSYRPYYFMIPFHKSLFNYYPADNHGLKLSGIPTFKQFVYSAHMKVGGMKYQLRSESNIFDVFEVKDGLVFMEFSCLKEVSSILLSVYLNEKGKNVEIQDDYYNIIITEPQIGGSSRQRFVVCISFPFQGKYTVNLFLNNDHAYVCHPIVLSNSKEIPFVKLSEAGKKHSIRFVTPTSYLTRTNMNAFNVTFRVPKEHSGCIVNFYDVKNEMLKNGKGEKVNIDKKITKHEIEIPNWFEITISTIFPKNGRFLIMVFLSENLGNQSCNWSFDLIVDINNSYKPNEGVYINPDVNFSNEGIITKYLPPIQLSGTECLNPISYPNWDLSEDTPKIQGLSNVNSLPQAQNPNRTNKIDPKPRPIQNKRNIIVVPKPISGAMNKKIPKTRYSV